MRILGCIAIVLGVLNGAEAQNFEWTHHFPSIGFSTSLEEVEMSSIEYTVYETGLYYKERLGVAVKRGHLFNRLSPALLSEWINDIDPNWQHYYVANRGMYQYARTMGLSLSYRIINRKRWTIEPNIGMAFITYAHENFSSTAVSHRFRSREGVPAPIRFTMKASRKFTSDLGLRVEYRLKELGLFLNAILINRPEAIAELSQAQGNNVIHYSSEEIAAPTSLLLELGLRVRIDDPFHWISIK